MNAAPTVGLFSLIRHGSAGRVHPNGSPQVLTPPYTRMSTATESNGLWSRFVRWWQGEGRTPFWSFCFITGAILVLMGLVALGAWESGAPLSTFPAWLILAALLAALGGLFGDAVTN